MADKLKAGDKVDGVISTGGAVYTDANGDLYSVTSGGGRKYIGARVDLATGKKTGAGKVRNDTLTAGQVKAEEQPEPDPAAEPQSKLDKILTHEDIPAIPRGVKAAVVNGQIQYTDKGAGSSKEHTYTIPGIWVDKSTGKTYKSKADYEKTQQSGKDKAQQKKVKKDIDILAASKSAVEAQAKADSVKVNKAVDTGPVPGLSKEQVESWNATLPSYMAPNNKARYEATATSGMQEYAEALKGISVLVGSVRKGTPTPGADAGLKKGQYRTRLLKEGALKDKDNPAGPNDPDTDTMAPALAGTLAGSDVSASRIKGGLGYDAEREERIKHSTEFIDVPILAGGDEMLYKLKASAVGNPALYEKTVQSLVDAGYLDPKYASNKVTKQIMDAYALALTEYGDTYDYGNKQPENTTVTFGDFLSSTAQYNKDHGIDVKGAAAEPEPVAPTRVDTYTDEAGVRAAARKAFQDATGKIDDSLVDSFVANFRGKETSWNDQRYQAQLADAGMPGSDPNAGVGLAKPDVLGNLDQTVATDPSLKAGKQAMDEGDYLRVILQTAGGVGQQ